MKKLTMLILVGCMLVTGLLHATNIALSATAASSPAYWPTMYFAQKAIDGNFGLVDGAYSQWVSDGTYPMWIYMDWGTDVVIDAVTIYSYSSLGTGEGLSYDLQDFQIQKFTGTDLSLDADWTTVDSVVSATIPYTFTPGSSITTSALRLYITDAAITGDFAYVPEIEVTGSISAIPEPSIMVLLVGALAMLRRK